MSEPKPAQITPNDMLPVGEAARIAGVSVDTMRRWEREGKVSAVRTPSNQRRFRRSDVEALLSRGAA